LGKVQLGNWEIAISKFPNSKISKLKVILQLCIKKPTNKKTLYEQGH